MGQENLLRGWKEIEAYARMSRKSLLRHGYPVRREGRGVFALRDDLDRFMAARPKGAKDD